MKSLERASENRHGEPALGAVDAAPPAESGAPSAHAPGGTPAPPLPNSPFTRIARSAAFRGAALFFAAFAFTWLIHSSFRHLPFWEDSLGYMIVNTVYMRDHNTVFSPPYHDTGHPLLGFITLLAAWKVFGSGVGVSHCVQWLWMAWLLSGLWMLAFHLSGRSWLLATLAAAMASVHAHFYTLANGLVPDVAMVGFYIWVFYSFVSRRPILYVVSFSLLLLTKVNSSFLAFFLVTVELGLFPLIRGVSDWRRKQPQTDLWRWWRRWVVLSLSALLPLALWLVFHRLHQGFWLNSANLAGSGRLDFGGGNYWSRWWNEMKWSLWWGEGNRDTAFLGMALLVIALTVVLVRRQAVSSPFPAPAAPGAAPLGLDHPLRVLASLVLQVTALSLVLPCRAEGRLARYYLTGHLFFLLLLIVAFAATYRAFALGAIPHEGTAARWKSVSGAILLSVTGLLATLNYAVRLHPNFADRIPLLPPASREHFRNWGGNGYFMNLQIADWILLKRNAIRWIERQPRPETRNTIIFANYPDVVALQFPEGGYLRRKRPFDVKGYKTEQDLLTRPWDYLVVSPFQMFGTDQLTERVLRERQVALRATVSKPQNTWDLSIRIYEAGIKEPSARP